ncbi:MAG: NAD(P)-dependent alcohol dehydrogenase [Spirochaetaceae bacterium]
MNAVYLDGVKNLVSGTITPPDIGPGDVRIKVHTMGICGSDIEYYLHNRIGAFVPQGPLVLGHELSGEVVETAPGVDTPRTGDRVAIDPSMPCRTCEYCRAGRHNLCNSMKFVGTAATVPHIPGGLAELVSVPATNCYRIPDHLSWGEGACLEPLAVAVHAVLRPARIAGAKVLVSGGGTIGQFVALAARAFGAGFIAVSDLQESRRTFAVAHGSDLGLDPTKQEEVEAAKRETGGFDVIFEASGAGPAVRSNLEIVRKGGTIVQIGSINGDVKLPANLIMSKELSFIGSFRYGDIYPVAMNLLSTRRVDVRPLISRTFPITEVTEAFELASQRADTIKVQIEH